MLIVVVVMLVLSVTGMALIGRTEKDRTTTYSDMYSKEALYAAEMGLRVGEALLLAAGGTVLAILWLLQLVAGFDFIADPQNAFFTWLKGRLEPSWATAAGLAVSWIAALGIDAAHLAGVGALLWLTGLRPTQTMSLSNSTYSSIIASTSISSAP